MAVRKNVATGRNGYQMHAQTFAAGTHRSHLTGPMLLSLDRLPPLHLKLIRSHEVRLCYTENAAEAQVRHVASRILISYVPCNKYNVREDAQTWSLTCMNAN